MTQYKQRRWQLDQLFSHIQGDDVEEALATLEQQLAQFETYRAELNEEIEAERFFHILEAYEAIVISMHHLLGFAYLSFAADTQDQAIQNFRAQTLQQAAQTENRTLFVKLWWKSLDVEQAERILAQANKYRYWLARLRLERPYTLSEQVEQVINLKNVNGPEAIVTLYDSITNRYTFTMTIDGQEKALTKEELNLYYRHPSPIVREEAYRALLSKYEEDAPILAQLYQYRVRDWATENIQLRQYDSPIAVQNLKNDIPDEVVDILLKVCQQQAPLFQRYFKLKQKVLNLDPIRRYDIYAPVSETESNYPFAEGVAHVLASFERFSPQMAELAERVMMEGHLDSEIRPGKMSGAFCMTVEPALTPWVLQAYKGDVYDAATLAHELGHAVHAMLADGHSALTQTASLPLAETASTFSEMLLVDHLLDQDLGADVERDLLFRQMDDAYATIMRQAYFALFEREAHACVAGGGSYDDLSAIYYQNLQEQFGEALLVDERFALEWVMVPHFISTPFYVYAYAFGQLLVLSLYQQYLDEGEGFKPRYIEILAAGGSVAPATILERAGIAIDQEAFWQGGFHVLEGLLERLEKLVEG